MDNEVTITSVPSSRGRVIENIPICGEHGCGHDFTSFVIIGVH